jgi:hypothetical protein
MTQTGTEVLHGQGFVVAASAFFLLLVLELVRRRKIGERFSLLWILIAVGMLLAATVAFPLLFRLAPLLGVVYPATALFLLAFLGLTVLSLYFTVILSQLHRQNCILAQRVALLEAAREDEPREAR